MVDIVSLDPGTTTGITVYEDERFRSFQLRPDLYPHPHESLFDTLSSLRPKKVIYEAFHFRQNMKGVVFTGVEYIGIIELYAQLNCLEAIVITPSDGKGFWDDKKLKAIGVHNPGHPHANDSTRLMLRHLMKDKIFMDKMLPFLKDM